MGKINMIDTLSKEVKDIMETNGFNVGKDLFPYGIIFIKRIREKVDATICFTDLDKEEKRMLITTHLVESGFEEDMVLFKGIYNDHNDVENLLKLTKVI